MLWLLVAANVIPSTLIVFTVMIEAIRSSETLFLPLSTQSHIPEDDIFFFLVFSLDLNRSIIQLYYHVRNMIVLM
jgi:hypothetical protein